MILYFKPARKSGSSSLETYFEILVQSRVRNFFQNLSGKWSGKWKKPKNQSGKWSGVEKKSIFHDNEVQKKYFSKNVQFLVMNHNTGNKIPYSRMSHPLHLHPHISLFWPKAYSEKTNWINLIRKWKKKWKNTKNQSGKWSGVATFHLKWKVPLKVEKNFELWVRV